MLRSHGRASRDWTAEGGCSPHELCIPYGVSSSFPVVFRPSRSRCARLRVRQRVDVLDAKFELA